MEGWGWGCNSTVKNSHPELFLSKMTSQRLEMISEARKQFEESTRSGDVKLIAQADVEFHDTIYSAADNPKLMTMLNNLREQMYRYRVEYLKDESLYPGLIAEHQKIYDRSEERRVGKEC